jgi:hypothetical protein
MYINIENIYTYNGATITVLQDSGGSVIGINVNGTTTALVQFVLTDVMTALTDKMCICSGDSKAELGRMVNSPCDWSLPIFWRGSIGGRKKRGNRPPFFGRIPTCNTNKTRRLPRRE